MVRKTAKKVDYSKAVNPELLLEMEEFENDLSLLYPQFFSYANKLKVIYKKICNEQAEDKEFANKIFSDFKKRGNFNLPPNLKDLVFEVAVKTKDFSENPVATVCRANISLAHSYFESKSIIQIGRSKKIERIFRARGSAYRKRNR